jgi:protoporphyrinogen oxidase
MSDETATNDTDDEVEQEVETPDPAAELAASKAALEAERAKFEAERKKQERNLNKWSTELAEREKRTTGALTSDTPLDPEVEKLLDSYSERKWAPQLEIARSAYVASITSELDRFAEKNGVDAGTIEDVMNAQGIAPRDATMEAAREAFSKALRLHKADTFDEASYRTKLKEEILAELVKDGEKVEGVRPKRTEVVTESDEDSMNATELYNKFKASQK